MTNLPNTDHISRHCKGSSIDSNGDPTYEAFQLRRDKGEEKLSVNWLEVLAEVREEQINKVRKIFQDKGFKLKKTAKFAVLNIDETINELFEEVQSIQIVLDESKSDPSHVSILNIPEEKDMLIGELIAGVVKEMHPALDE